MTEAFRIPFLSTLRHYFSTIEIAELPLMPPAAQAEFLRLVDGAEILVEYGCGGSTVAACRRAMRVISVDSDRLYMRSVAAKVKRSPGKLTPLLVDIGNTGDWGRPLYDELTPALVEKWKKYPAAPWDYLWEREDDREPDLVLIDGRFRVACALESLLRLEPESETVILLDDYGDRPEYHVIEPFLRDMALHDRMLSCKRASQLDTSRCRAMLEEYSSNWH